MPPTITFSDCEKRQLEQANASDRTPDKTEALRELARLTAK